MRIAKGPKPYILAESENFSAQTPRHEFCPNPKRENLDLTKLAARSGRCKNAARPTKKEGLCRF